ncbi:MAG: NUDIX domain-containing protein [Hyphomicrobiales bacterium]|nr:NUDIX domain-containing protein [Hyphomicrobiales bacterium]
MRSGSHESPVLGVSTLVRSDRKVLLVQRARPPFQGVWAFPGGKVAYGELLATAAAREVLEETGIVVAIEDQIDRAEILPGHEKAGLQEHYVVVVFAGTPIGGTLAAADDAADARWFAAAELASLTMTADTARILIARGLVANVSRTTGMNGRAPNGDVDQ